MSPIYGIRQRSQWQKKRDIPRSYSPAARIPENTSLVIRSRSAHESLSPMPHQGGLHGVALTPSQIRHDPQAPDQRARRARQV